MRQFLRALRRLLLVAIVLSVLITLGLYAYRLVFSYSYDDTLDETALDANIKPDNSITNIALFGLDTRSYEIGTRSDCMMILTVDNTRGKLKLTSLMRDSLVPIPGHGESKLCHAYTYGGAALAIRTINRDFGTNITDYVAVDFAQLKVLVDLVGGVYIDVSEEEQAEANKFIAEYCTEKGVPEDEIPLIESTGYQYLTGVPAMCYARIRKGDTGDDWGRVERQGEVLEAMFAKVQTMSKTDLLTLVQKFLPYVTTSLSTRELLPLVVGALQNGMPTLEHTRVPLDREWEYSSDGVYIEYDLDHAAQLIDQYIYEDIVPNAPQTETITSAT